MYGYGCELVIAITLCNTFDATSYYCSSTTDYISVDSASGG